jgi:hypothetical protein
MWTLHTQQQQRGVQFRPQHKLGEAPAEAVKDRAAQDHEQAVVALPEGDYPATRLEDEAPAAGKAPRVDWDEVVQPQPHEAEQRAELDDDGRGEDAEATVAQEQQDSAGRFNRND